MKEQPKSNKLVRSTEWKISVYDPSESNEPNEDNCYVKLSDKDAPRKETKPDPDATT